jgi:ATP-binding cassette, subfamily B, heavy metal transporter
MTPVDKTDVGSSPPPADAAAIDIGADATVNKPLLQPPVVYRRMIVLSSIMFTFFLVILGPVAKTLESRYTATTSSLDVVLLCGAHCVLALSALTWLPLARLLKLMQLAQYECLLLVLLVSTKWWLLRPMAAYGSGADVFMTILCGVLSVAHLVSAVMITRHTIDAETAVRLRWESTKVILGPYFMPEGNRNKVFVALTWCVLGVSKACAVAAPLILGKIIFNLTNADGLDAIDPSFGLIVLYSALNLIPSGLTEVQDSLYVKVFQTAYAQVAEFTFRHVHSLSVEWHLKKRMGNVIRSLDRGMEGADSLMYNALLTFLPAIVSAVVSLIVVAEHLDRPEIAAICYLGFGLYCWITLVGTVARQSFRQEMNDHDNDMHDKASDSLINFETVKCFTNEEHETQSYIASVKQFQRKNFKDQAMMSMMNFSQASTHQCAMMGSMMVAAYAVSQHDRGFQVSDFITVQAYVLSVFSPLDYLGYVYSGMMNGITDIQNLSDLLAARPDVVDAPDAKLLPAPTRPGEGMEIEFRDVSFHYPTAGESSGLKHVSFTVPRGTNTALVGPTGSGKTTISRLLFRFYDPIDGGVYIDGTNIRDCTQKSVRSRIGVVPQESVMFNDTIMNNIRYGRLEATDEEVKSAAKDAHIYDSIMKFELGFDTMCGERGLKLSGGEKQRIAIARCLLKNPPIVLLDEATSALDNKTERLVQEALSCLEGRTAVIIAHRLSTVQYAHQIIVLRDGMIAERGTHSELLALGGLYSEMWDAQGSTAASPTTAAPPEPLSNELDEAHTDSRPLPHDGLLPVIVSNDVGNVPNDA